MKKADLEKLAGRRIESAQQRAGIPSRFGVGSASAVNRREQRRLDQAQGLIPFAVKIDAEIVEQVRELAKSRSATIDELVAELLRKGLAD